MINFIKRSGGRFSLFFFMFVLNPLHASTFILETDALIDKRAVGKINEIGLEVKEKTGIGIYIYAKEDYGFKTGSVKEKISKIREVEDSLRAKAAKPYVILTMALNQTHVNILYSDSLKRIIDKDDILNGYIVPLLASKDKNELLAKTSAAMLNGYAQIADVIAADKGIELSSSIGSGGKTAGTIWRVFIYFIVVTGLLLYTYAVLKQKKR